MEYLVDVCLKCKDFSFKLCYNVNIIYLKGSSFYVEKYSTYTFTYVAKNSMRNGT